MLISDSDICVLQRTTQLFELRSLSMYPRCGVIAKQQADNTVMRRDLWSCPAKSRMDWSNWFTPLCYTLLSCRYFGVLHVVYYSCDEVPAVSMEADTWSMVSCDFLCLHVWTDSYNMWTKFACEFLTTPERIRFPLGIVCSRSIMLCMQDNNINRGTCLFVLHFVSQRLGLITCWAASCSSRRRDLEGEVDQQRKD